MINVIATLHVTANVKDAVKAQMKTLVDFSRAESGCVRYDLYQIDKSGIPDVENTGGDFTVIESWADMTALNSHAESKHFTDFVESYSEDELKLTLQVIDKI